MRAFFLFFSLPLLLWLSMFLSWQTLSQINFAYPLLYEVMSLDETIATYGPLNLHKDNFHLTTDEERFRLFGEIVYAINHQGVGLAEISYHGPQGEFIDRLLRVPEVVHLQDVANLIDRLQSFSWWALGLLVLLFLFALLKGNVKRLNVPKVFLLTLASCIFIIAVLIVFGAEEIFYYLHTIVFPDDHQWFFYYQDSLMTTMMRAPDLFAAIAVLLVLLSLFYFYILLRIMATLFVVRARHQETRPSD